MPQIDVKARERKFIFSLLQPAIVQHSNRRSIGQQPGLRPAAANGCRSHRRKRTARRLTSALRLLVSTAQAESARQAFQLHVNIEKCFVVPRVRASSWPY